MLRFLLSFVSMLALGALTLGTIAVLLPWLQGRASGTMLPVASDFQLESGLLGLTIGVLIGYMSWYNWADIPRRMVNWVLVRERQFFYYVLIAGCIGVLIFY